MVTGAVACSAPGYASAHQATPAPVTAAVADEELYLEVALNGEPTGLILRFTKNQTGLRSSVDNLQQLGLEPARFGVAGQAEFALDLAQGLRYQYDAARQSIALTVDDALRAPFDVNVRSVQRPAPASVTPGAVINYDAYSLFGAQASTALYHEARYFNANGVFSANGTANLSRRRGGSDGSGGPGYDRSYTRYDTFWNHSDPDTLTSLTVGDLISSSLSWSRAVRMGGVQWRKNFELRPDLLTFPVASVGGSALVPSALSLYVNGVQQYNTQVPSGPFIVNQVAGLNGAGQATVVTRDPLGRSVSTTLPLYVDTRMLAAGLVDYSFELGALRRDFGIRSFDYASTPVASGSGRYGVSDVLTVEGHGELAGGLANAGGAVLYRLGQVGVFNATVSASAGRLAGMQGGAGYRYVGGRYSVEAQTQRASRRFGDLAARDGSPVTSVADRISLSAALPHSQSVSVSYVGYRTAAAVLEGLPAQQDASARIGSIAYALGLSGDVFFSLSAYQDILQRSNRGFFASLSVAFGNRVTASANAGRQNASPYRSINLARTPDFDGGIGWNLQSGTQGPSQYQQAQLQYLGNYGQLTGITQRAGQGRTTALDVSGALVVMDGTLAAARQVGAGFALVSTDGVAKVPVMHENRQIGLTDASGHFLVPNLNPYSNNQIAIDTADLPLDARVRNTSMNLVPKRLSGVLARFPVERYSAATVILHDPDGQVLAAGLPVHHVESDGNTVVGFDGVAFIDDLQADNHVLVGEGAARCVVRFAYQRPADNTLPVIGPLVCRPLKGVP